MADLFRKSSLEKLSSPEQLDRTLTVTSPMSWLALAAVTVIAAVTIVWSVVGTLPTVMECGGVIVGSEGTNALFASGTGAVSKVSVSDGDAVKAGDTIMEIEAANGGSYTVTAAYDGRIDMLLAAEGDTVYQGTEVARVTPQTDADQSVVCYVPVYQAGQLSVGMDVMVYPMAYDHQKYGHMEGEIIAIDDYAASVTNMSFILGADNQLSQQFLANGAVVAVTCRLDEAPDSVSGYYWTGEQGRKAQVDNGQMASVKIVTEKSAPISRLFTVFGD